MNRFKTPTIGLLAALALGLINGCGAGSHGNATGTGTPAPKSGSPSALGEPSDYGLNIFAASLPGDAAGSSAGAYCAEVLVAASTNASYSQGDIDQMSQSIQKFRDTHGVRDRRQGYPAPPATLRLESVALDNKMRAPYWEDKQCTISFQVTNVGNSAVSIPSVGMTLTGSSRGNDGRYALVEGCSVIGVSGYCGPQLGGGPLPCNVRDTAVTLTPGATGTRFAAADTSRCPEVDLSPNTSIEYIMNVASSDAQVFPAEPYLDVRRGQQSGIVALPALASAMTFADPSQFDCYRLNGRSLTQAWSGSAAVDWEARSAGGAWCA